jgi:hypothetical protein
MRPAKTPTDGRRESPRRLLLLLGLAVALGGLLAWDWWGGGSEEAPQIAPREVVVAAVEKSKPLAAEHGADADPDAHPLASLTLDDLGDTLRRPLFERKRRPVEAPKVPASAPLPTRQADPHALTLQGIIFNEGHSAIALMRRTLTGQSVRLQEGDTVDGWTVERIEAERVHLLQGDTRIALQLFAKR